ncbi:MAG: hypothetical protein II803_06235 [Firmicutes bacterium]|nr:hypothetical protein [Bacillota bacterium]
MKSKPLWILLALVVIAAALVLLLHTTGLIGNSEPAVSPAEQAETSEKAPEATVKPSPTQTPEPTVDPELPVVEEEAVEQAEPGSVPAVTPYPAEEGDPDENELPPLP